VSGEVPVVALRLTGQQDVQPVVDVIGPLGVQAGPAIGPCGDHAGVVEVALGDEVERAAEPGAQGAHLVRELRQDMGRRVVAQLVDGVEP
jgi:hypothetical protein